MNSANERWVMRIPMSRPTEITDDSLSRMKLIDDFGSRVNWRGHVQAARQVNLAPQT